MDVNCIVFRLVYFINVAAPTLGLVTCSSFTVSMYCLFQTPCSKGVGEKLMYQPNRRHLGIHSWSSSVRVFQCQLTWAKHTLVIITTTGIHQHTVHTYNYDKVQTLKDFYFCPFSPAIYTVLPQCPTLSYIFI